VYPEDHRTGFRRGGIGGGHGYGDADRRWGVHGGCRDEVEVLDDVAIC